MGDMGDYFRDLKEASKTHKEATLQENKNYLDGKRIQYTVFNKGFQYNIRILAGIVSFYPSTNKWVFRGRTYYGNAETLIKWITGGVE